MSNSLRRALVDLFPSSAHLGRCLRAPQRWVKRALIDEYTIRRYLKNHSARKLEIGVGLNVRSDWLNGDLYPVAPGVICLDATRRFPFGDGVFDYAFSEHMIEHIPYDAGRHMLAECFRVLRPGGKIRICTPDLVKLMKLYRTDRSDVENAYLAWATREFIPSADGVDPVFVINNYVRDWGHQFIYDEPVLERTLRRVGFTDVIRCELGESADEHLRGLENPERMPPGFLDIESMVLEAVKK